jgi:kinesin family protein 5
MFNELRPLVHEAARGFHAAVISYGPTGSGKTHTMFGDARVPGIVPHAVAEMLSKAGGEQVSVSMVELHNDVLIDLLAPSKLHTFSPLKLRGDAADAMPTIDGAREISSTSLTTLLSAVRMGLGKRCNAATNCNATSSRSHLIVSVTVGTGRLTILDLAGTERVKRSGVKGEVLRETQSINRSLQGVGEVVDALRRKSSHVPFRSCRLARFAAGALNAGTATVVVVCLPQVAPCREEALGALCFAERVRLIQAATESSNS